MIADEANYFLHHPPVDRRVLDLVLNIDDILPEEIKSEVSWFIYSD